MTDDYALAHGTHTTPQDGRCAMEWVSHLAGEPHSDAPACVSPALRAMCVTLNDGLPDGPRQRLRPYLTRTIGTAGDGLDPGRGWLAIDWLIRSYAPAWLTLVDSGLVDGGLVDRTLVDGALVDHGRIGGSTANTESAAAAAALRHGPAIVDEAGLRGSLPILHDAGRAVRAARKTAFARGSDPLSARLAAARGARAGREAAWTCAGAAAWATARVTVSAPHAERARGLVRTLAGDAAAIAVCEVAADDVCGAPGGRAARRAAIGPTLEALAGSAIELLHLMLPTETVILTAAGELCTH